jgi:hypothetical protein
MSQAWDKPDGDRIAAHMDLSDEETAALMMIPLMWASKMIKANAEFAAEMETLDIKGLIEELRARGKRH